MLATAILHQLSVSTSQPHSIAMMPIEKTSNTKNSSTPPSSTTSVVSSAAATIAAATNPVMMNAATCNSVYPSTTGAVTCTVSIEFAPMNIAEPSAAGVKNGRPEMKSISMNHSATTTAPIAPVINPSRIVRCSSRKCCHPRNST